MMGINLKKIFKEEKIMTLNKKMISALGISFGLTAISSIQVEAAVVDSGETEATVTFDEGPLELIEVPSAISFGSNTLSPDENDYIGTVETTIDTGLLEVSDARGSWVGWHVVASMSEFSQEGEPSLEGSTVSLAIPEYTTTSTVIESDPTLSPIEISNAATSIPISAAVGEGMGRSYYDWTAAGDVTLSIPAGAATVGVHTATITWSLEDVPQ